MAGLGTDASGEIVVVVVSSDGSVGGVLKPGVGMNGGASTFKGFPDASPPKGDVIPGVGRDLVITGSSKVRFPDGDLRRRSSCRLFARGRTPPIFPPKATSETERLKGLIKRSIRLPLESKQGGPDISSAYSTTGRVRIASSIWREGGRPSTGGGCWSSSCSEVGWEGGKAGRPPLLPARSRSPMVKEC